MTRLITDRDVMVGAVSSPIVLSAGVLLTPAARDRAIAKGLVIVERDGEVIGASPGGARPPAGGAGPPPDPGGPSGPVGASPSRPVASAAGSGCGCPGAPKPPARGGGCSCGGACAAGRGCRTAALPDGLHLVRVQAGEVVWSRPVTGEVPATPPR